MGLKQRLSGICARVLPFTRGLDYTDKDDERSLCQSPYTPDYFIRGLRKELATIPELEKGLTELKLPPRYNKEILSVLVPTIRGLFRLTLDSTPKSEKLIFKSRDCSVNGEDGFDAYAYSIKLRDLNEEVFNCYVREWNPGNSSWECNNPKLFNLRLLKKGDWINHFCGLYQSVLEKDIECQLAYKNKDKLAEIENFSPINDLAVFK